jgi:hypothetical protein
MILILVYNTVNILCFCLLALGGLGAAYACKGNDVKAAEFLQEALLIYDKCLPPTHSCVHSGMVLFIQCNFLRQSVILLAIYLVNGF